MKKIKITKTQKEYIDKMNMEHGRNAFKAHMELDIEQGTPIDVITNEGVSLIFNGWYEVIGMHKAGDYFYDFSNDEYLKVKEVISDDKIIFDKLEGVLNLNHYHLQKVTEPWKVKLLDTGRPYPRFRDGDKITFFTRESINNMTVCKGDMSLVEKHARGGRIKYLYPVESRIEFE